MNTKKPLILIVNDDGINSKGINFIIELLKNRGEIIVVAPQKEQSAKSNSLTINEDIRIKQVFKSKNLSKYFCTGTPTDCVKIAINKIVKRLPNLCISGINHGSNSSINVYYSGTVAAALEASINGIPSLAFSLLDYSSNPNFYEAKEYILNIINKILQTNISDFNYKYKNYIQSKLCLNINIPNVKKDKIKGVRVCRQARSKWIENYISTDNKESFRLTGKLNNLDKNDKNDKNDLSLLEENFITVVPINPDRTFYEMLKQINYLDE